MAIKWAMISGAILRLFFILRYDYISPDGTHYASLAARFAREFVYKSYGSQFPDIIQPPLYPLLIAPFTYIFSPEVSGKLVSLMCGVVLIYLGYKYVLSVCKSERMAGIAAWLLAIHPSMISMGSEVVSEGVYILLLSAIIYSGWQVLKSGNLKHLALATLYFGLGVLTRPEAIVYFFAFQLILVVAVWRRLLKLRFVWVHVAAVLSVLALYGLWAQQELGYFTISPKLNFVRVHGRLAAYDMRLQKLAGKEKPEPERDRFQYKLSADSTQLASHALLYRDPVMRDALQRVAQQVPLTGGNMLKALVARAGHNAYMIAWRFVRGSVLPLIFMVFLAIGLYSFIRSTPRDRKWLLYTLYMMLPLGAYLLAHIEERFLFILIPMFLPLFNKGFDVIAAWLEKKFARIKSFSATLMIITFFTLLPDYKALADDMQEKTYYARIGELMEENNIKGKIAASRPQAVFFSGNPYSPLPFASIPALLVYFRHNDVQYVLIEDEDITSRAAIAALVENDYPGFEVVMQRRQASDPFILLKIKP